MNQELISVIIPCYNAEQFVEHAIQSVMMQTYSNLEIIVIDDCSQDNTGSIIQNLADKDSRIIYIKNEANLKLPKTLNKGINVAKGTYIARMDADDFALPDRLEKQMKFLKLHPNIDIVGCNIRHIDECGNLLEYRSFMPTSHVDIVNQMSWKSTLIHPAILAKKSFFIDLNGFNEQLSYAEDYDLWIRGIIKGKNFANIADILLYYRIHNNQMTSHKFNSKHAHIIQNFLFDAFKETKKITFLFGILIQTRFFYWLIHSTSNIRQKFKK